MSSRSDDPKSAPNCGTGPYGQWVDAQNRTRAGIPQFQPSYPPPPEGTSVISTDPHGFGRDYSPRKIQKD